ncbi:cytochrome P450 [Actinosynnema sp. NPDC020468]|uniref:cytochrome P450 n=1 Tax=Actinosynnema sp. NPDC020468 TaxID=3154488 RepID=UPI0034021287
MTALPPRFDATAPDVLDDPYPTYARLRDAGPLCRCGPGTWGVTRYADVARLLGDRRLANGPRDRDRARSPYGGGPADGLLAHMLSGRRAPDHTRLRALLGVISTPAAAHARRAGLRAHVADLLAPGRDGAVVDAVADVAFPLQARLIGDVVGLPAEVRAVVWPDALRLGRVFIPYAVPTPAQVAEADRLTTALREAVGGLLAERRARPRGDLLSVLAHSDVPHEDAVDNVVFLLFAGFETTMNVIGSAFAVLSAHPGQFARLTADPGLVGSAADELLRYDPPAQYTVRLTEEPVEVGDRVVREGRMVLLMLGSANRDGARFDRPDEFDVTRLPNPHVAFGGGPHHCLGRVLGRVEVECVLDVLARGATELRPARPARRLAHPNFRAHTTVPVTLVPR